MITSIIIIITITITHNTANFASKPMSGNVAAGQRPGATDFLVRRRVVVVIDGQGKMCHKCYVVYLI